MTSFKELNIKPKIEHFAGDKIKISKVLNKEIQVQKFKVVNSKFEQGPCLHLQIMINETKHVVFTGSAVLRQMIQEVKPENFPFTTTIVEQDEHYEFT